MREGRKDHFTQSKRIPLCCLVPGIRLNVVVFKIVWEVAPPQAGASSWRNSHIDEQTISCEYQSLKGHRRESASNLWVLGGHGKEEEEVEPGPEEKTRFRGDKEGLSGGQWRLEPSIHLCLQSQGLCVLYHCLLYQCSCSGVKWITLAPRASGWNGKVAAFR